MTVVGVKAYLGVDNTAEFAYEMRQMVSSRMPLLSSRIHRLLTPDDNGEDTYGSSQPLVHAEQQDTGDVQWSWPDAEKRLMAAFERKGFSGWAEAAAQELEAEGEIERRKRRHA